MCYNNKKFYLEKSEVYMDKNSIDKVKVIQQTINDTKYITDSYKPCKGVKKIVLSWMVLYAISMFLFFIIDEINIAYKLYNLERFYDYYNIFKITICILIPVIVYCMICKIDMSAKERSILKIWIIFPGLLALDKCLPTITAYMNAESLISFYASIPIALFINLISLIYLYSCYKEKHLLVVALVCIVYMIISFVYLSKYKGLLVVDDISIMFYNIINYIHIYGITEILSTLLAIVLLKGKEK
jgi:hypothetical protein